MLLMIGMSRWNTIPKNMPKIKGIILFFIFSPDFGLYYILSRCGSVVKFFLFLFRTFFDRLACGNKRIACMHVEENVEIIGFDPIVVTVLASWHSYVKYLNVKSC